jgi:enterochelin esterase-like enzyme
MPASTLFRPTFADLRAEIERRAAYDATADEIDTLIEQFLLAGGDTPAPCIEYDGTVTWLYRDPEARGVAVVGDILGHDPNKTRMSKLPGCDVFALTAQMPLDARMAYSFVVERRLANGQAARVHRPDPLNPRQILATAPMRALSVLEMPNARPVPELDETDGDDATSAVYYVVGSADRAIWARVWVFLPPSYDAGDRRYPTLYLNDGESYLLSARTAQIMDALLAQGEVAPAIIVFVQRSDGAAADDSIESRYARFLADELVPWVDERFATSTDPQERVIGGAGAGGTVSLYAALERPDVFGRVLAQSPAAHALTRMVPALLARNAARGFGPPQCYIDVGRYERTEQQTDVQALCATLLNSGAAVSYQDFGAGHSFLGWRATLPDALRFHFGAPPIPAL